MRRHSAAGRTGERPRSGGGSGEFRSRGGDATERLLAVLESRSRSELTASLDDPSPDVARAAIRRLVEIDGGAAGPELRARLLSADLSLVSEIAKALRTIGDGSAADLAIAGLKEEPYARRLAAVLALGTLGEARAAGALREALSDPVAGVRVAVLGALARIGSDPDAADDCTRLLSDPDPSVRIAAVRAVARIVPRPGLALASRAGDSDRHVRLEVARHLAGLPDQAAAALLADADLRVREAAARNAGRTHLGRLAVLLVEDPASDVRHAAAATLGRSGDERAAEVLVRGLEDRDAIVRVGVIRALERLLTRLGAIARLCEELQSERPERRRASLYALAHAGGRVAAERIERLAVDPDPDVRLALVQTVDALVPHPRPLVERLAVDADDVVRHGAEIWLLRAEASN